MTEQIRPLMKPGSHSARKSLSIPEILDLVVSGSLLVDRFYVLIDALNETYHQHRIVSTLLSFCQACPNLRILVTCTADPQIESPELQIQRMSNMAVDHDIQVYVQHRLSTEPGLVCLGVGIKERIQQRMAKSADGTSVQPDRVPPFRLRELTKATASGGHSYAWIG